MGFTSGAAQACQVPSGKNWLSLVVHSFNQIRRKVLRAGASVSATEAARVAVGLREMAREFERLWLARSKPSRLRDNLTLIQRAAREAEQVGRRRRPA